MWYNVTDMWLRVTSHNDCISARNILGGQYRNISQEQYALARTGTILLRTSGIVTMGSLLAKAHTCGLWHNYQALIQQMVVKGQGAKSAQVKTLNLPITFAKSYWETLPEWFFLITFFVMTINVIGY
jgi:hypothetical protein